MGVKGTNGKAESVVWLVRNERCEDGDNAFVKPKVVVWLMATEGAAAVRRFVDCARGIVAFMTLCSALSNFFAVGRRSRSEREGFEVTVSAKAADGDCSDVDGGTLRTSMYGKP